MHLYNPAKDLFTQLSNLLAQLSDKEYMQPCSVLSNATIGQHLRHIIELYQELEKGYEKGVVHYEERNRSFELESNKESAAAAIGVLLNTLDRPDKPLLLISEYGDQVPVTVHTNYYRELIYNMEHTVHHMALIRVGILTNTTIQLPDSFGVASSTLKFRQQQCAQ